MCAVVAYILQSTSRVFMLKVDSSVQDFINNPDGYLLKVTYGKDAVILNADKKGIWTWIKARFYEWLGFGTYDLRFVTRTINRLDAIPEYSPLKAAANKVIAKWSKYGCCLEPFDQYKVTLKPNVELTLEKVLEVAGRVIVEDERSIRDFGFSQRESTLRDIEMRCNDGLLRYPEIYFNRWIRERGGDHCYRVPEDLSRDFFETHFFTILSPRVTV